MLRAGLFATVIALALLLAVSAFGAIEEHCGVVTRVVDGDTFYVSGLPERVRLADVNAPELSTAEGQRAKAALEALLLGRWVCLDIDDLYRTDRYGRFVAVAYLDYNKTHWLNINQWLVERGYAVYVDYPNEFHPPWPLYVAKTVAYKANETTSAALVTVTVTQTATTTVTTTKILPVTVAGSQTKVESVTYTVREPARTVTKTVTVKETEGTICCQILSLLTLVAIFLILAMLRAIIRTTKR